MSIRVETLEEFLSKIHEEKVKITRVEGVEVKEGTLKGYGYGVPLIITYEIKGEVKRVVLETMKEDIFGHEHKADRAQALIWAYEAYNKLPNHARAIALGYFDKKGNLIPIKDFEEAFIVTEFVEGKLYYLDLERIRDKGELEKLDIERCEALATYLASIHSKKAEFKRIYVRRIRDLIGHGECIMGLIDSYPEKTDFLRENELKEIETKLIDWRWKLKKLTHRASLVHGDFHPWNVFFIEGTKFYLTDRSRGEYGEAADDVSAMAINYLFFSLQRWKKLYGPFEILWNTFFEKYLDLSKDEELLKAIQPFFAWRSLVIASPIWYPNLPSEVRRLIFNFINNILDTEEFKYKEVNNYLK